MYYPQPYPQQQPQPRPQPAPSEAPPQLTPEEFMKEQSNFNTQLVAAFQELQSKQEQGTAGQVMAPYSTIGPYHVMPLRDTFGGNIAERAKSFQTDRGRLAKETKEVLEDRKKRYEGRITAYEQALASGKLNSREITYVLEQITALEKGLMETQEESAVLNAEAGYDEKYGTLLGRSFESFMIPKYKYKEKRDNKGKILRDEKGDVIFEKDEKGDKIYDLDKNGERIPARDEWGNIEINPESTRSAIDTYLKEAIPVFGKEKVYQTLVEVGNRYAMQRRERKQEWSPAELRLLKKFMDENGIDDEEEAKKHPDFIKERFRYIPTQKDYNEMKAFSDISRAGFPEEVTDVFKKEGKNSRQKKLWSKGIWRDGEVYEVHRLSRILDYKEYEQYALEEKVFDPEFIKKTAREWLMKYWNDVDKEGGATYNKHAGKLSSTEQDGEPYTVRDREHLLKMITESGLPEEIKQEFRDLYEKEINDRDRVVEDFTTSRDFERWVHMTDHGDAMTTVRVWNEHVLPELIRLEETGLIRRRETVRVWEAFEKVTEWSTKVEARQQNIHRAMVAAARKLMGEERTRADLYNEKPNFETVITAEAIMNEINDEVVKDQEQYEKSIAELREEFGKSAENEPWKLHGKHFRKFPPREEMGGADRFKLAEKIARTELEREDLVKKAKIELDRLDVLKPKKWDLFTAQVGQGFRMFGNMLKIITFGHAPKEGSDAIRQNWDNIKLLRLGFREQLSEYDKRRREIQKRVANLSDDNIMSQTEEVSWSKDLTGIGYHEFRDAIGKEKLVTYKGLITSNEEKKE